MGRCGLSCLPKFKVLHTERLSQFPQFVDIRVVTSSVIWREGGGGGGGPKGYKEALEAHLPPFLVSSRGFPWLYTLYDSPTLQRIAALVHPW
jgi:hypothetical protein